MLRMKHLHIALKVGVNEISTMASNFDRKRSAEEDEEAGPNEKKMKCEGLQPILSHVATKTLNICLYVWH